MSDFSSEKSESSSFGNLSWHRTGCASRRKQRLLDDSASFGEHTEGSRYTRRRVSRKECEIYAAAFENIIWRGGGDSPEKTETRAARQCRLRSY